MYNLRSSSSLNQINNIFTKEIRQTIVYKRNMTLKTIKHKINLSTRQLHLPVGQVAEHLRAMFGLGPGIRLREGINIV